MEGQFSLKKKKWPFVYVYLGKAGVGGRGGGGGGVCEQSFIGKAKGGDLYLCPITCLILFRS